MAQSDKRGKGGGARKYGRNKVKCERYRARKGHLTGKRTAAKRQIKPMEFREKFIIDSATLPEGIFDRFFQTFRPIAQSDHLATEVIETVARTPGDARTIRGLEGELCRMLRASMRRRVLAMPKRKLDTERGKRREF